MAREFVLYRHQLAKSEETDQTAVQFNEVSTGGPLSHSETVQTRRRKQRAKKDRERIAKIAKKLGKQGVKTAGAGTPTPS